VAEVLETFCNGRQYYCSCAFGLFSDDGALSLTPSSKAKLEALVLSPGNESVFVHKVDKFSRKYVHDCLKEYPDFSKILFVYSRADVCASEVVSAFNIKDEDGSVFQL
jgi:hypothetical protein